MATAGKNSSLWIGSPLAKVSEGTDISMSVSGKTIDTTNFDSSEWEEYINSTKSFSISFTANFIATNAQHQALMNNIINASQSAFAFEYRLTSGATPKFSGNVITESFDISAAVGDKISLKVSLKGSGALGFIAV
ncbi:MAG TPA: phage tail tube protein [Bacillota bacterium]|nr:phage tail tube protein [Bacillota bacterium]